MPDTIGRRVKSVRQERRISQSALAIKAGLTQPTISSLERGESHTSGSLAAIADALGVSALWLQTGLGEREHGGAREFKRVYTDGMSEEEFEIRLLASKGSCGNGRMYFSDDLDEPIIKEARWFKRLGVKPETCVALHADGDSMAHFIMHGDIVIFNTSVESITSGDIYCIDTPDGLRIKRIHKRADGSVTLSSDNPDKTKYPDEVYTSEQAAVLSVKGQFIYRQGGIRS